MTSHVLSEAEAWKVGGEKRNVNIIDCMVHRVSRGREQAGPLDPEHFTRSHGCALKISGWETEGGATRQSGCSRLLNAQTGDPSGRLKL